MAKVLGGIYERTNSYDAAMLQDAAIVSGNVTMLRTTVSSISSAIDPTIEKK